MQATSKPAVKETRVKCLCPRCGSKSVVPEYDLDSRQPGGYCLLCGRTYTQSDLRRDMGRAGGLATYKRYGREHMQRIGRLGGRPKYKQPPAPTNNSKNKEVRELPNNRGELLALYRLSIKKGEAEVSTSASKEVIYA